jgi:hypothetical protein
LLFLLVHIVLLLLVTDTVILKDEVELFEHLLRFFNNKNSPLRLCYRASLHGWSSQDFHKLCDDKAGTVVLVKVGNWIFGGYTDQTWQGNNYYFTNFHHFCTWINFIFNLIMIMQ